MQLFILTSLPLNNLSRFLHTSSPSHAPTLDVHPSLIQSMPFPSSLIRYTKDSVSLSLSHAMTLPLTTRFHYTSPFSISRSANHQHGTSPTASFHSLLNFLSARLAFPPPLTYIVRSYHHNQIFNGEWGYDYLDTTP